MNDLWNESLLKNLANIAPNDMAFCRDWLNRLQQAWQEGHSYLALTAEQAEELRANAPILVGSPSQNQTPLLLDKNRLFFGRLWQQENDVAAEVVRLSRSQVTEINVKKVRCRLQQWFADEKSAGQKRAVALALLQRFMVITGGPGTGKTTTVAKLLALLCEQANELPRLALAAPTGKAAARMTESLRKALNSLDVADEIKQMLHATEGQTVHRLLNLQPPQMQARYHRERPLAIDVLVVDEASMLDLSLMLQILRALPDGCRVIFLGDEDQLPSVSLGNVLADLLQRHSLSPDLYQQYQMLIGEESSKPNVQTASATPAQPETATDVAPKKRGRKPKQISENQLALDFYEMPSANQSVQAVGASETLAHVAKLHHSHRFGADSGIGCLARAVNQGDADLAWQQFSQAKFAEQLSVAKGSIWDKVKIIYQKQEKYWQTVARNDVKKAFECQAQIVVLSAQREDAHEFNRVYRKHLGVGDDGWFDGQIIMITRNDMTQNVFNGDIGLVLRDAEDDFKLKAYFPAEQGLRKIALTLLPQHETAFAMTVHKSQGSEYEEVHLFAPENVAQSHDLFSRSLLYTAITRAKQRFVFWGEQAVFEAACRLQNPRRSALSERIAEQEQNVCVEKNHSLKPQTA
ncbi:MAG: AAA family ATPase [Neisseria sp.]|nr:AAA family ATPase [Neisseria sp.]